MLQLTEATSCYKQKAEQVLFPVLLCTATISIELLLAFICINSSRCVRVYLLKRIAEKVLYFHQQNLNAYLSRQMNTDIFAMSLYTDIQKITQLPCSKENSLFILQQKYNTNKRNLRMRKYKPPKNANLYDKDDNDSYNQICNDMSQEKCCLPENEIACSIKEATGGIDYSNENLEEQWRIRQMEASSHNYYDCKSVPVTVGIDSSLSEIKTNVIKDTLDEENILRQCRLNKNAAIRGLLKNHIISTQDLEVPIDSINITQSNVDIQNTNMFSLTNLYGENHIKLVPCQEDPEVLHQPLQAYGGIDENKYKDIDFSVPHIGKKKTVTSRQFFLGMNDSDFDFVRKDSKKKK